MSKTIIKIGLEILQKFYIGFWYDTMKSKTRITLVMCWVARTQRSSMVPVIGGYRKFWSALLHFFTCSWLQSVLTGTHISPSVIVLTRATLSQAISRQARSFSAAPVTAVPTDWGVLSLAWRSDSSWELDSCTMSSFVASMLSSSATLLPYTESQ